MAEKKLASSNNSINECFLEERCVLNKVMQLLGKRWSTEALLLIEKDVKRFSSLKRELGDISDNVLFRTLQQLSKSGLVQKEVYAEVPPRKEYHLSPAGLHLAEVLHELCRWSKLHLEDGEEV